MSKEVGYNIAVGEEQIIRFHGIAFASKLTATASSALRGSKVAFFSFRKKFDALLPKILQDLTAREYSWGSETRIIDEFSTL